MSKQINMDPEFYVSDTVNELFSEIELISEINHRAILNFFGCSFVDFKNRELPVIVTEKAVNGSLSRIFQFEQKNESVKILDDTKKLILIYGIAVGMKYLHSNNIIHCNLNPSNIFLDEFLFPKIAGFNKYTKNSRTSNYPLIHKTSDIDPFLIFGYLYDIGYDIYKAPELFYFKSNYPSEDVYSFAMIVYRLITGTNPFSEEELSEELFTEIILEDIRPKFTNSTPNCYKNLIEKCWAVEPSERPTFDEIVYHLKTNTEFITDQINKEEFQNYIKFVDRTQNSSNENELFDDFLQTQNKLFRKIKINFNELRNKNKLQFSVDVGTININNFERQSKIGSGSFGSVYKAVDKRTDIIYAAKVSIYDLDQCPEDIIINMSREVDIISNLNHPSIYKFIGYSPKDFKNNKKPVIITEFASNGSLEQIINMERNGFSAPGWDDTAKLINIYGIAAGMLYLHQNNILHRDLKPANILVDEFLHPKIADFGLSKKLTKLKNKENNIDGSGLKGTYVYCAPEIIYNHSYSKEGDVYAFGMIIYEIMTNEVIYQGLNQFQVILELLNNHRPKFNYPIPYCYKKLIERCWDSDPTKRPSFTYILRLLESDPQFITKNINKEDFLNYVSFIKDSQNEILSNSQNNKKQNDFSKGKFNKVSFEINKDMEFQEELDNIFLDLSKYERKSIINKGDMLKIYQIIEKETNSIFSAQISMIKICQITKDIKNDLVHDIEVLLKMYHPSLLKFIGFSPIDFKNNKNPVIVTEAISNGTLDEILQIERNGTKIPEWDDTKKLINIYGIVSGIACLHSNNIIHRCLSPKNVFLDDVLFPKIGYLGLSSRFLSHDSLTHQSMAENQFTQIYTAPEVFQSNQYTKKGDVYSFAFIVYEILSNEKPFNEIKINSDLMKEIIIENKRPIMMDNIPLCYRKLIEKCWSKEQDDRPTFEEIVYLLKMDSSYITSKVKKEYYQKYIHFIDEQTNLYNKPLKIQEDVKEINFESESLIYHQKLAENGNIESQEFLTKKFSLENDSENTYKYFSMLIKQGRCTIPLEYAVRLYNEKNYKQAFNYFCLISKVNHQIAKFYIGIMKFSGIDCEKSKKESYMILKHLSDNGIDCATDFLENNFENV